MTSTKLNQAVIVAGGLGSRLGKFSKILPKPMVPLNGIPGLTYLLRQIKKQGIEDVLLLLGYKAEVIENYFGDGSSLGLNISYSVTDVENDTGKRVKLARNKIHEYFLLMYCDNYWPMDVGFMWKAFIQSNKAAQLVAYQNHNLIERNNLHMDRHRNIHQYDKTRQDEQCNVLDLGYFIASKAVLDVLPNENVSFENTVFPALISENQLSAYLTAHKFYSTTDQDRLLETEKFLQHQQALFVEAVDYAQMDPSLLGVLGDLGIHIFVFEDGHKKCQFRDQNVFPVTIEEWQGTSYLSEEYLDVTPKQRKILRALIGFLDQEALNCKNCHFISRSEDLRKVMDFLHINVVVPDKTLSLEDGAIRRLLRALTVHAF